MNTYHLIDKPVRATQWTGNIKVFRNALEMMLKTDAIALIVGEDNLLYIACKDYQGSVAIGDYFARLNTPYWQTCDKTWFEERYAS